MRKYWLKPILASCIFLVSSGCLFSEMTNVMGIGGTSSVPLVKAGNFAYTTDGNNSVILQYDLSNGAKTSLAGATFTYGCLDGTGTGAYFSNVKSMTMVDAQYVYVPSVQSIRRVHIATGVVTTVAGSCSASGHVDAVGTAARFTSVRGIFYHGGYIYVTDGNRIRRVNVSDWSVQTLAGTASTGTTDATGTSARFTSPAAMTVLNGVLYIVDVGNQRIRAMNLTSLAVTTVAGSSSGFQDGIGTAARFNFNTQNDYISSNGDGHLFVSDHFNSAIRKINVSTQAVTTVIQGSSDIDGERAAFSLLNPSGLHYEPDVGLYFTNSFGIRLLK